jgi:hypothetical protein
MLLRKHTAFIFRAEISILEMNIAVFRTCTVSRSRRTHQHSPLREFQTQITDITDIKITDITDIKITDITDIKITTDEPRTTELSRMLSIRYCKCSAVQYSTV